MKKPITLQRLFVLMSAAGILSLSSHALAAGFQFWEQDGASIGNYHAGRSAIAEDASTNFYNPAGLVRMQNQQLVIAAVPYMTGYQFRGTVVQGSLTGPYAGPQQTSAQGGTYSTIPTAHYAAPVGENIVMGLSFVEPFGLDTDYGTDSFVRYVATLTSIQLLDLSPAIGFGITDKLSFGMGLDLEHSNGEFDFINTDGTPSNDTLSQNSGSGSGVGYHFGTLYQFTPHIRVGLSHHSKITHHLRGSSKFEGPLANSGGGGVQSSDEWRSTITFPATTSFSVFGSPNTNWDFMGSVTYTQWNVVKELILYNTATTSGGTTDINVPEYYHNTWNFSVGANYHFTDQLFLRSGVGVDETPVSNRFRNLQLPDSNRIAIALGGHYQATKSLGFDVGWTHLFGMNTRINNLGTSTTLTNGSVRSNTDVYGFQGTWDIV
jgi:long-chain fatty acid transport protein